MNYMDDALGKQPTPLACFLHKSFWASPSSCFLPFAFHPYENWELCSNFFGLWFWKTNAYKCSIFTTSKTDHQLLCLKVRQKISLMKTNTGVFVVLKKMRELKCQFSGITEILWWTFWSNNWRFVFDVVKMLRYIGVDW